LAKVIGLNRDTAATVRSQPEAGMIELAVLALSSLAAGFVNSIAGGGGLVQLPVLLWLFPAAPPAMLFGTNKAAMVWGTAWAAGSYTRHVRLPWHAIGPAIVAAVAGGACGARLASAVPPDALRAILPVMLAAVLAFTLLHKDLGSVHSPLRSRRVETLLAVLSAAALGCYDGFFGPGTGSFFIFFFVRVLGYDFLHAAASAKVLNTATNLAALAAFATTGNVWWQYMIPTAAANVLGSAAGSRMALTHGTGFIRAVFILIVAALILKTGYDAYAG
jgi:uncharacterized membrane protein YfcA